ncbi:SDR family oxidoreductase [Rubrobacter taiwanensis]|jgi:putative NADH-flavin reductase|uniref:SDR family oxidoreductase n=1 Tax=Rubrobacter taiwanensis TaxID=185139 RepID=A0A4R1BFL1_9ACTN|nr:SDR family oxidoreductase [Rubrobacter taiwanensis]TCJ15950.1 SDR family oxidoreductase [Rubrobacter taiwanensis]
MRVAVFGATGRTGRLVVERLLEEGHEVIAFVRDPSKILEGHDEKLRTVRGDVLDAAAVEEVVEEVDAVLVALGHTKTSPKDVQARGTQNIVAAMRRHGVRRLISLTGAGVRDPQDEPKVVDRAITGLLKLLQRDVLEDAERHAEIIRNSGLDWTLVRVPRLVDGERTGEYRAGYIGKDSGTRISRADVADFMVRQLTDDTYLRRAPVVSY